MREGDPALLPISDDQQLLALRAMKRVATACGAEPLTDADRSAHDKLEWLIADVQRQNLHSITGRDVEIPIDQWILPYQDQPDPDLAARYHGLYDFPQGTFGRTFADFYSEHGFAFPGEPDRVNAGFATPHDPTHVLSGYDTSPQGELLVSTFTAGMHPHEPMSGHILPVIMTGHMGVELVEFTGKYTGGMDPEKFWVAWDRGSEVRTDVFAPDWDFWGQVARPADEVRRDYAVPRLEARHAAGSDVADWYRPSA